MPYKNHYPCSIDTCEKSVKSLGLCSMHWKRFKTHGDTETVMPRGHFAEQPICIMEDCNQRHSALGFCQAHYREYKTFCDKDRWPENRSQISNSTQKRYITVYVPDHPFCTKQGTVLQHRLVMEQMVGRYLERYENVHHKNGDRTDNTPDNLELWSVKQPSGQRAEDKVKYAIDILELYAPELLAKVDK